MTFLFINGHIVLKDNKKSRGIFLPLQIDRINGMNQVYSIASIVTWMHEMKVLGLKHISITNSRTGPGIFLFLGFTWYTFLYPRQAVLLIYRVNAPPAHGTFGGFSF